MLLRSVWLVLVALSRAWSQADLWAYPPADTTNNITANPLFIVGSQVVLRWVAATTNSYNISLTQQGLSEDGYSWDDTRSIVQIASYSNNNTGSRWLYWTVNHQNAELAWSPCFYLDFVGGDQKTTSRFFNISDHNITAGDSDVDWQSRYNDLAWSLGFPLGILCLIFLLSLGCLIRSCFYPSAEGRRRRLHFQRHLRRGSATETEPSDFGSRVRQPINAYLVRR